MQQANIQPTHTTKNTLSMSMSSTIEKFLVLDRYNMGEWFFPDDGETDLIMQWYGEVYAYGSYGERLISEAEYQKGSPFFENPTRRKHQTIRKGTKIFINEVQIFEASEDFDDFRVTKSGDIYEIILKRGNNLFVNEELVFSGSCLDFGYSMGKLLIVKKQDKYRNFYIDNALVYQEPLASVSQISCFHKGRLYGMLREELEEKSKKTDIQYVFFKTV